MQTTSNRFQSGLTSFEITILIVVISLFFIFGAIFLHITSHSAYHITAKHDIIAFADFQKFYFKLNGTCLGSIGQTATNSTELSDIKLEKNFISEGVAITIVAGDPEDPYNKSNPYTFQCKHEKSDIVYEYNFVTDAIIER